MRTGKSLDLESPWVAQSCRTELSTTQKNRLFSRPEIHWPSTSQSPVWTGFWVPGWPCYIAVLGFSQRVAVRESSAQGELGTDPSFGIGICKHSASWGLICCCLRACVPSALPSLSLCPWFWMSISPQKQTLESQVTFRLRPDINQLIYLIPFALNPLLKVEQ